MREVLRCEKKYLMTYDNYLKSRHYFSNVLHTDEHNGDRGYVLRSLYFDTLKDDDFYDKIDGLEVRKKIRIRVYNPNDNFGYLEVKAKQGDFQKKKSLKMSKEDILELINLNYSVLLKYEEDYAKEIYGIMATKHYVPKTINQYRRYAFIAKENSIRLTFDSEIKATETCFDLFDENLNLNPVFNSNFVVFEVKYNGFLLSYIKDIINTVDRIQTPVSKYCLARSSTIKYIY